MKPSLLYSPTLSKLPSLETFAASRGFTEDELSRFGVRVEEGHVVIPTLGREGAWYERLRCDMGCHPKYSSPKGEPSHLYNPLGLGPHSPLVWIAEGELDTLSLVISGVPAVGVLGTQAFFLPWRHLFSGDSKEIVIAFDSDQPGDEAAERLAQLWDPAQVSRFSPAPYNDINDWFREDREGLRKAVILHGVE